VRLDFSRPGKPTDNPFIESFNGRLRDEYLNTELFFSVADTQAKLLEWQRDYNEIRPHSSLGHIPPRNSQPRGQLTRGPAQVAPPPVGLTLDVPGRDPRDQRPQRQAVPSHVTFLGPGPWFLKELAPASHAARRRIAW
jgi:hypothetical protein